LLLPYDQDLFLDLFESAARLVQPLCDLFLPLAYLLLPALLLSALQAASIDTLLAAYFDIIPPKGYNGLDHVLLSLFC